MSNELDMWTVYDHPRDFPNTFVARRFMVGRGGKVMITDDTIIAPDLKSIRIVLANMGLVSIQRSEDDDPKIVEVWL